MSTPNAHDRISDYLVQHQKTIQFLEDYRLESSPRSLDSCAGHALLSKFASRILSEHVSSLDYTIYYKILKLIHFFAGKTISVGKDKVNKISIRQMENSSEVGVFPFRKQQVCCRYQQYGFAYLYANWHNIDAKVSKLYRKEWKRFESIVYPYMKHGMLYCIRQSPIMLPIKRPIPSFVVYKDQFIKKTIIGLSLDVKLYTFRFFCSHHGYSHIESVDLFDRDLNNAIVEENKGEFQKFFNPLLESGKVALSLKDLAAIDNEINEQFGKYFFVQHLK